jgi:hypothetical protein
MLQTASSTRCVPASPALILQRAWPCPAALNASRPPAPPPPPPADTPGSHSLAPSRRPAAGRRHPGRRRSRPRPAPTAARPPARRPQLPCGALLAGGSRSQLLGRCAAACALALGTARRRRRTPRTPAAGLLSCGRPAGRPHWCRRPSSQGATHQAAQVPNSTPRLPAPAPPARSAAPRARQRPLRAARGSHTTTSPPLLARRSRQRCRTHGPPHALPLAQPPVGPPARPRSLVLPLLHRGARTIGR